MPSSNQKTTKPVITPNLPIYLILEKWPETMPVFLEYRMSCIGCYMSSFDTLEDALHAHNLPVGEVLASLNQKVAESDSDKLDRDHE